MEPVVIARHFGYGCTSPKNVEGAVESVIVIVVQAAVQCCVHGLAGGFAVVVPPALKVDDSVGALDDAVQFGASRRCLEGWPAPSAFGLKVEAAL